MCGIVHFIFCKYLMSLLNILQFRPTNVRTISVIYYAGARKCAHIVQCCDCKVDELFAFLRMSGHW